MGTKTARPRHHNKRCHTKKLNKPDDKKIIIRSATLDDLDGIIKVENEIYGPISEKVVASRSVMTERVMISGSWFLVAEANGEIVGFLSLQPTNHKPEDFVSWDDSTDEGTLKKSFCETGKYIYGVALTVGKNRFSFEARDQLLFAGAKKMILENKKLIYLSGRMPGYHRYSAELSAEEYYNKRILKHGKDVAFDPQIRMYESFGLKKIKLVENGFVGDRESCDYGIVFVKNNTFYNWPFRRLWAWLLVKMVKTG